MLRFLMLMIAIVLATMVITQIIIPAYTGRTFFPLFRRKYRAAVNDLTIARRKEEEARWQQEAAEIQVRAATMEVDSIKQRNKGYDDLIEQAENEGVEQEKKRVQ